MPVVVSRKEKETNQQVLRRFNRLVQSSGILQKAREKMEFTKSATRNMIRSSALRREKMRREKQWY